ncbi:response regulator [Aureimonas psammosilenae]|uniref:response regulator n=1 Tax=Aureimonas psammosilenae TaxID=2495496 RepID=UPI0012613425|nr:hypothetical protein [Aureimonas psammosilenae]
MFCLDHTEYACRRVLVVDGDPHVADNMAEAVRRAGGFVLGPVPDALSAIAMAGEDRADFAMLDIQARDASSFATADALRDAGILVRFVAGYDDWCLSGGLDEPSVRQMPSDGSNVLHLRFTRVG